MTSATHCTVPNCKVPSSTDVSLAAHAVARFELPVVGLVFGKRRGEKFGGALDGLFRDALAQALGYGRHAQRKILDTLAVKEVMATDVVTIKPDDRLVEAARLLTERKIGCLPVVENGRLIGILTEGDFVSLIARGDQ